MLNIECYSAPQLFRLPYQYIMIDEDYKNVRVFAIESQSEDESTRDRSVVLNTRRCGRYVLQVAGCRLQVAG